MEEKRAGKERTFWYATGMKQADHRVYIITPISIALPGSSSLYRKCLQLRLRSKIISDSKGLIVPTLCHDDRQICPYSLALIPRFVTIYSL